MNQGGHLKTNLAHLEIRYCNDTCEMSSVFFRRYSERFPVHFVLWLRLTPRAKPCQTNQASMAIKWCPCKKTRNDFTVCWYLIGQKNTKNFWHQSELRTTPAVWNWSGKNLSPGALLALLCFSSSPFSFARLDFPLPPRSALGSPRMCTPQLFKFCLGRILLSGLHLLFV